MSVRREQLARVVGSIEPGDELEAEQRRIVLDWIGSGAELYRRVPPDLPPTHLVSFDGVRWIALDELNAEPIERLDPHMHRFARKLRAAQRIACSRACSAGDLPP